MRGGGEDADMGGNGSPPVEARTASPEQARRDLHEVVLAHHPHQLVSLHHRQARLPLALAAGLAGYLRRALSIFERTAMFVSAALLLAPITEIGGRDVGLWIDVLGAAIFALAAGANAVFGRDQALASA